MTKTKEEIISFIKQRQDELCDILINRVDKENIRTQAQLDAYDEIYWFAQEK